MTSKRQLTRLNLQQIESSPRYENYWNRCLVMIAEGKHPRSFHEDKDTFALGEWMLWVNRDPKRKAEFNEALTAAGHIKALEGEDILDNATNKSIRVAQARAEYKLKLAKAWDRQRYADHSTQTNTIVNLSDIIREISERKKQEKLVQGETYEQKEQIENHEAA